MTELRKCLDCEKDKPFTDFNLSVNGRGGRGSYCRECRAIRMRKWYETSPKSPRVKAAAGDYRPVPGKVSLPHLPCLARIDALLERI
jgi:hypothetical protein